MWEEILKGNGSMNDKKILGWYGLGVRWIVYFILDLVMF